MEELTLMTAKLKAAGKPDLVVPKVRPKVPSAHALDAFEREHLSVFMLMKVKKKERKRCRILHELMRGRPLMASAASRYVSFEISRCSLCSRIACAGSRC